MAQKSVYIRPDDTPVWEAAERMARRRRTSVSHLIVEALEAHLPRIAATEPLPAVRWSDLAAEQSAA